MRKDLIIILIPSVIILLFVARNFNAPWLTNPFASVTPYPAVSANPGVSEKSTAISPAASKNIEVLSPRGGDSVKSGFAVKGNARTFESNVAIRLTDLLGNVLVETFTLANAPDVGQFGAFEKTLDFQTDSTEGVLEVFQYSAKDGSEIDKVTIPLIFE